MLRSTSKNTMTTPWYFPVVQKYTVFSWCILEKKFIIFPKIMALVPSPNNHINISGTLKLLKLRLHTFYFFHTLLFYLIVN